MNDALIIHSAQEIKVLTPNFPLEHHKPASVLGISVSILTFQAPTAHQALNTQAFIAQSSKVFLQSSYSQVCHRNTSLLAPVFG